MYKQIKVKHKIVIGIILLCQFCARVFAHPKGGGGRGGGGGGFGGRSGGRGSSGSRSRGGGGYYHGSGYYGAGSRGSGGSGSGGLAAWQILLIIFGTLGSLVVCFCCCMCVADYLSMSSPRKEKKSANTKEEEMVEIIKVNKSEANGIN